MLWEPMETELTIGGDEGGEQGRFWHKGDLPEARIGVEF